MPGEDLCFFVSNFGQLRRELVFTKFCSCCRRKCCEAIESFNSEGASLFPNGSCPRIGSYLFIYCSLSIPHSLPISLSLSSPSIASVDHNDSGSNAKVTLVSRTLPQFRFPRFEADEYRRVGVSIPSWLKLSYAILGDAIINEALFWGVSGSKPKI